MAYYRALLDSTTGWHEENADPWPWLTNFVDVLADAYRVFADRAAADRADGSKQERVQNYVLHHAPPVFRIADIRRALPGVSDPTIRLGLGRLRDQALVTVEGTGRGATWRRLTMPGATSASPSR